VTEKSLRQYVWDGPTRLFHWLLVGLIGFSWWSAENAHMDWHYKSGLAICGLVVFRLLWGFFGSTTARFRQFVKGPRGVWSYVRGTRPASIGHSPLGGLSVIALLLAVGTQATSGLFTVDVDGLESGPLSHLVSFDQGRVAASIHDISFNVLLALMALHIVAIAYYLVVKRRNLIGAMVVGYERTAQPIDMSRGGWLRLVLAIAAAALLTWWIAGGARLAY
jgi:cytochrome b